jgi:hypothetical protein
LAVAYIDQEADHAQNDRPAHLRRARREAGQECGQKKGQGMTKKISVLALVLALTGPAYADPPAQQIEFPPVAGQSPALVTPSNPFPVEEQGGQGVDGSIRIDSGAAPQLLFGGRVPPHGFFVCVGSAYNGAFLVINDAGTATTGTDNFSSIWLNVPPDTTTPPQHPCYVTPPGYRPPGPVSVVAGIPAGFFMLVSARMW